MTMTALTHREFPTSSPAYNALAVVASRDVALEQGKT